MITPAAGRRPGTPPKFSRGYVVAGVVHGFCTEVHCGDTESALCGQRVTVSEVYQAEAWPKMEHGVCRRCLQRG